MPPDGGFRYPDVVEEWIMTRIRMLMVCIGLSLLFGCADMTQTQQRTLSGGALGAAAGAGVSAISGGDPLTGAAIGGAGGAAVGHMTRQRR